MKKIFLIALSLFWGITLIAQEKDTTKLKVGKTKIIIVGDDNANNDENDENKEKLLKLEAGLSEFEKLLKEKELELETQEHLLEEIQKKVDNEENEDLKKQEELLLDEEQEKLDKLAKEIETLEEGIEDIEDKIEDFRGEENEGDNDVFNWDFENEWAHEWDNMSPFGKKDGFKGHWAGFELGLNNYVNSKNSTLFEGNEVLFELNPEISWAFTVNFMEFNIPFGENLGLVTGMGTTWNNYHFRNNVNIYEDDLGVITAELDSVNNYSKNSLNLWYVNIPLLFEIQFPVSNRRHGIHLAAGVVGSLKLSSKRKAEFSNGTKDFDVKDKADFQIPALKYGFTVRVGYRFISLFANYDMTPLFNKDRGPELYPISVGLVLLSF